MTTKEEMRAALLLETGLKVPGPLNGLLSYHHAPNPQDVKDVVSWGNRVVGDSGAYSVASIGATIDIDAYAEWVIELQGVLCWSASLDVIGDPEGSYKNFVYLRNKGTDVIPTVHYPAKPEVLDRYHKLGCDFIGLGGMVPRNDPVNLKRWLVQMFLYAKKKYPEMRFHGWGCTSQDNVNDLPFWSVDSSGFASGHRWGRIRIYESVAPKRELVMLDGKEPYQYADKIKRAYGINARDIEFSTPDNKHIMLYVAAMSSVNLETFLHRRHGVITAPRYGNDHVDGMHVHNVMTVGDYRTLRFAMQHV